MGLQRQRGVELLAHEAAVHVADVDHIDVLRLDAGMGDRLARRLDDQRFRGLAVELAEFAVGPTDDAGGHVISPQWAACIYTYICLASGQCISQEICSLQPYFRRPPGVDCDLQREPIYTQ